MSTLNHLVPRLVVQDAVAAIDFYARALGAEEASRFTDPHGRIVHAELSAASVRFMLTEEQPEWGNRAPSTLGGTPVILHLGVEDADAVGERMVDAGAEIVFPIADQFYGAREGRLRDPFGHLWIISQHLADLPSDEIQRRLAQA